VRVLLILQGLIHIDLLDLSIRRLSRTMLASVSMKMTQFSPHFCCLSEDCCFSLLTLCLVPVAIRGVFFGCPWFLVDSSLEIS